MIAGIFVVMVRFEQSRCHTQQMQMLSRGVAARPETILYLHSSFTIKWEFWLLHNREKSCIPCGQKKRRTFEQLIQPINFQKTIENHRSF